jgi:signal transduction histidine kinase
VHDVLAHTVSLISIQADVAAEALEDDPRAVSTALEVIRASSREALSGLRSTVGVLRDGAAGAPRDPVGGVAQLGRLVEWARSAGLDIDVRVEGDPRPLPVVVDAAVHRIVQEAVTNVLRHAAATRACVELRYLRDALTVRVVDNGRARLDDAPRSLTGPHARPAEGPAGPGGVGGEGYGLRGMRERVNLLGGRLQAGPQDGGGFAVEATLPVGRAK